MEGPNKRYRCWICQQDLSRSVYYRHMRRNGCPALVRMQTKECHTTKGTNTRTSQETSNLSVDMEEESSDMDNVDDRYTLCTEEAEEQPTSAADDLHLEDRNVNVMENADAYQETEVVLDSDYDDLAFDCTGCSTPEGSKTGWFASDDKQFPFGAICLFLNYYQLSTRQRNATSSFFPKSHDCSNLTNSSIQLIIKAPNESISFFTECNENKTEC